MTLSRPVTDSNQEQLDRVLDPMLNQIKSTVITVSGKRLDYHNIEYAELKNKLLFQSDQSTTENR